LKIYKVTHATFMNGCEWDYDEARYLASSYDKALAYIKYHEDLSGIEIEHLNENTWRIEYDCDFRYFIESIEIDVPLEKLYEV